MPPAEAEARYYASPEEHEELSEQAQFAVAQGRDDLAEAAIARQLDMEAQIPVLETALKDIAAEQAELESYVAALLARKREMEAELTTFQESRTAASGDGPGSESAPAELEGLAAEGAGTGRRVRRLAPVSADPLPTLVLR